VRQQIIQTAAFQQGVTELPAGTNKNPYGAWYGMNGVPWCAIFVSWVFDQAGHPLGPIDSPKGYHYCASAYNFWKRNNQLISDPQPADIVLFDWDGDGKCDHTGIFLKWITQGETFQSWEGNTSVNNNSNGGQVMLRTRSVTVVKAFVNPGVFGAENFTVAETHLKKGSKGADVTALQKSLHELKYSIVVDGDFGKDTEKIVTQFQKEHGLIATGVADDATLGALEAELNKPKVAEKKTVTGTYLKKGSAGALVVALQKSLNNKGAKPKLKEDGMFGTGTTAALKTFQKKNKLTADGIAGPQTFKALGIKT
jgi:peptidoglycan hydrolase-like protein with peptidoglycan-binding domain